MLSMLRSLTSDEAGATAIEYGLIAALISVACISAFTAVGNKISSMMSSIADRLQ